MFELVAILLFLTLAAVAVGVFFSTFRDVERMKQSTRRTMQHSLVGSAIFAGAVLLWTFSESGSMGPTAKSVAIIVIPIYLLVLIPVGFAVSFSAVYAAKFLRERFGNVQPQDTRLGLFIVAVMILSCSLWFAQASVRRSIDLSAACSTAISPAHLSQLLERAIRQHDVEVLGRIARNDKATIEDLRRIFESCKENYNREPATDYLALYGLAQNPKTPPDILAVLAKSNDDSTRIEVAENPNVPVESLRALATDPDSSVRTRLTSNPNLPLDVLEKLRHDRDQVTRNYAESNLGERQKRELVP